jgi:hypothetical protein
LEDAAVDDLVARQGPPVSLDTCTALGCILVSSLHHCLSHGWTIMVRVERDGPPAQPMVTSYYPTLGWTNNIHNEGGPSGAAPHAFGLASLHSVSFVTDILADPLLLTIVLTDYTPEHAKSGRRTRRRWSHRALSSGAPWKRAVEPAALQQPPAQQPPFIFSELAPPPHLRSIL